MKTNTNKKLLKMMVLAMLVALGVVISPILRVEGMCPMAHFINIVCSVLLGPYYSLACAAMIGILRMTFMGIPPLALTGAIFGAYLSGLFYRMSKGNLLMAVLGEVIGTGIIGAIVSYPVMSLLWGKEGLTMFFYIPSFVCGTLIGGSIAFAFLKKLSSAGTLARFQTTLGSQMYEDRNSVAGNAVSIAAIGVIIFVVINIVKDMFKFDAPAMPYITYGALGVFILAALVYMAAGLRRKTNDN